MSLSYPFTCRQLFIVGKILCVLMLATAYLLQWALDLEPCSLCILQRFILWLLTALFAIGIWHNPKAFGCQMYCLGIIALNILGIALAGRHLWIQYALPADQVTPCIANLETLLAFKPIFHALQEVLMSHECTKIDKVLFLPLSLWSMMGFIGLTALACFTIAKSMYSKPGT